MGVKKRKRKRGDEKKRRNGEKREKREKRGEKTTRKEGMKKREKMALYTLTVLGKLAHGQKKEMPYNE